jgi:hypothetical protein
MVRLNIPPTPELRCGPHVSHVAGAARTTCANVSANASPSSASPARASSSALSIREQPIAACRGSSPARQVRFQMRGAVDRPAGHQPVAHLRPTCTRACWRTSDLAPRRRTARRSRSVPDLPQPVRDRAADAAARRIHEHHVHLAPVVDAVEHVRRDASPASSSRAPAPQARGSAGWCAHPSRGGSGSRIHPSRRAPRRARRPADHPAAATADTLRPRDESHSR